MTYEAASGARRTVTAFFDDRADADEAVSRLAMAGIPRDRIRLVPGQESGTATTTSSKGQSGGGFWDSLADLFLPDEDRSTYAEGLRRGGYLVSVMVSDAEYDQALDILDDEGTIDIDERASSWRSEGWSGHAAASSRTNATAASGYSAATSQSRRAGPGAEQTIPIAEEELRIGKRDVSHGRVRVRSYVVETPVNESVELREENVHVERRPVDRATGGAEDVFQDRTIELEERAEEAVVAKEARVREELVVNKEVGSRTETVSDTVRHTEVDIEDERTGVEAGRLKRAR